MQQAELAIVSAKMDCPRGGSLFLCSSLTEYTKEKPENTGVLDFTHNTYHYTC